MMSSLYDQKTKRRLVKDLKVAKTIKDRLVGLLSYQSLPSDQALWIHRCNSIHTFFMKFPIDCVFLDSGMTVKAIKKEVKPNRLILPIWGASSVIEMTSGQSEQLGIRLGDQLYVGT